MILFAHEEVEHVDTAQSAFHLLPEIAAVTIAILLLLFVTAKFLGKPDKEQTKEDDA